MTNQHLIRNYDSITVDLAHALHTVGVPAHRLEAVVSTLAEMGGNGGQLFAVPTALIFTFGTGDKQAVQVLRTKPGDCDLGRLVELEQVAQKLAEAQKPCHKARAKIHSILSRPELYSKKLFV